MREIDRAALCFLLILALCTRVYSANAKHIITKRNYSDQSVRGYLAERTCWWNEVCKEEFHSKFRCRCPRWSYCRAPGRYYDAHCSMTRTGYIWTQPETSLSLEIDKCGNTKEIKFLSFEIKIGDCWSIHRLFIHRLKHGMIVRNRIASTHIYVSVLNIVTLPGAIDYSANRDKNSDVNGFQDTLPSVPFHFPGDSDQDTCAQISIGAHLSDSTGKPFLKILNRHSLFRTILSVKTVSSAIACCGTYERGKCNKMTDKHNHLPRFLSVFVIILFRGVTSDIDDGGFDENNFNRLDAVSEALYRLSQDQFPESYNHAPLHPVENRLWRNPENLGEISGVAVDPLGNPVIFHRGDRTWNYETFNENAEYQEKYKGPIHSDTVLTLDPKTGDIIRGWGNQTFYLPHGIHIDGLGNIWLTDIALHQVFKYSPSGVPRLILGQRFEPGNDMEHFCQPTSVAVLPSGEIVVADGYCNNRIVLFDKRGNPKYSIGEHWISLRIPHALTILPNKQVCIADRENSRIVCLDVIFSDLNQNPEFPYSIRHRQFGRIFSIASYRGFIYAVNGMTSRNIQIKGFTIDPINRNVTEIWGPESSPFMMPHAIAVCPYGTALYVSEIGPNKIWKFDLLQT